jgi:hypothetical protein
MVFVSLPIQKDIVDAGNFDGNDNQPFTIVRLLRVALQPDVPGICQAIEIFGAVARMACDPELAWLESFRFAYKVDDSADFALIEADVLPHACDHRACKSPLARLPRPPLLSRPDSCADAPNHDDRGSGRQSPLLPASGAAQVQAASHLPPADRASDSNDISVANTSSETTDVPVPLDRNDHNADHSEPSQLRFTYFCQPTADVSVCKPRACNPKQNMGGAKSVYTISTSVADTTLDSDLKRGALHHYSSKPSGFVKFAKSAGLNLSPTSSTTSSMSSTDSVKMNLSDAFANTVE